MLQNSTKFKYNLKPKIFVEHLGDALKIESLIEIIKDNNYSKILIETYPGVNIDDLKTQLIEKIPNYNSYWSENFALKGKNFRNLILDDLTEDRVFGKFTEHSYKEAFIKALPKEENIICYGIGSYYLLQNPDLIIYVDISRWEIQTRYRKNENVFFGQILENETIKNFKRGYFIEWRMADKIKKEIFKKINYYIDGNNKSFNSINKDQLHKSINFSSKTPFRLVPYFDYGVWGGKWMEEKLQLGKNIYSRWAWGFDGVPEENSIILKFKNIDIEMPSINIVYFEPLNLLGEKVWSRFGEEFPIRFDFLDTIKGQNLSLQVHPNTQYIRDNFRAQYGQEESYYILDVDKNKDVIPICYLGVKDNIDKKEFEKDLYNAQKINKFNVKKYVNVFKVKKHDHLLHPSGVIHASASGCMVLEISSTPYIFTFKLWDWARLGLNGKPRPINIKHGLKVMDYSFNSYKTKKELISPFKIINDNNNFKEEKTGLHKRQFIETRRFTIKNNEKVVIQNHDSVNMLNLVEGQQVIVESIDNSFKPLIINYAETFIIPEYCKEFTVRPTPKNIDTPMLIQAFVK